MKEVIINECDFCNKVSFNKGTIRKHEKMCFFNPVTRSCATCLWFSPLIVQSGYPVYCYLGKINEVPQDSRLKLNTQCKKWMNHEIYFEHETCENQDEMEEKLLSGKVDYFKSLQKRKKNNAMLRSFSNEVMNSSDPPFK